MAAAAAPQLALVPQLAQLLGPAADAVAAFGEMAPGIPWSNATLEQILEGGVHFRLHEEVEDDIEIGLTINEESVRRKAFVLHVTIQTSRRQRTGTFQAVAEEDFPRSVQGLRQAIELCQKQLAKIRTHGFCPCYKRAPAAWRSLRVNATGKCGDCVLQHCLKK